MPVSTLAEDNGHIVNIFVEHFSTASWDFQNQSSETKKHAVSIPTFKWNEKLDIM